MLIVDKLQQLHKQCSSGLVGLQAIEFAFMGSCGSEGKALVLIN